MGRALDGVVQPVNAATLNVTEYQDITNIAWIVDTVRLELVSGVTMVSASPDLLADADEGVTEPVQLGLVLTLRRL